MPIPPTRHTVRRSACLAGLGLVLLLWILAAVPAPPAARAQGPSVIAFSDGGAGGRDLWTVRPDGSGRSSLVSVPAGREAQPSWSPDGRRVAFSTELPDGSWAIARADADGGELRLLTNGPGDLEPDWSRDGRFVAFSAFAPSVAQVESSSINIVGADGRFRRTVVVLASTAFVVTSPTWSPDGSRLAFVLRGNSQGGELYVTDVDGRNTRRLFSHPGWDDIDPAWSPDGRYLLFASGPHRAGQTADQVQHGIWLMDLESGALGSVFTDAALDLRRPAWSPDGSQLALDGRSPGERNYQLFTAPATGGLLVGPLTTGAEPAWGPAAVPPPSPTAGGPSPTTPPTVGFPTSTPPDEPPTTEPTGMPFPTIPPQEPSPTGPPPTFPWPTASPTATATTTPSATPTASSTPRPSPTPTAPPALFLPWLESPPLGGG